MDRAEAIETLKKVSEHVKHDPEYGITFTHQFVGAYEMALAALQEQEDRKWISVSERLPQEYGAVCKNVILLMDDGFVTVGWLNQVTGKGYYLDAVNDDVIREPISRFTHWMPLPEPPEEGETQ